MRHGSRSHVANPSNFRTFRVDYDVCSREFVSLALHHIFYKKEFSLHSILMKPPIGYADFNFLMPLSNMLIHNVQDSLEQYLSI